MVSSGGSDVSGDYYSRTDQNQKKDESGSSNWIFDESGSLFDAHGNVDSRR